MAGGQSLLPVLRMRLNAPEVVIDLGRIDELRGVREDGDAHRHRRDDRRTPTSASDPLVARARGADHQGGRSTSPTRRSGTAAPSAGPSRTPTRPATWGRRRWPSTREFVIAGPGGTRTVAAADFFVDLFETAIGEDEILTEIRIPKHTGWGAHYEKFVRVAHQWPIVAVAATVRADGGTIAEARIGLTNMGSTPLRARAVEQALVGSAGHARTPYAAAAAQAADGTNPPSDLNGDADYRQAPGHRPHPAGRARGCRGLTRSGADHHFTVPARSRRPGPTSRTSPVAECFPGAQVTWAEGDEFTGS